MTSKHSAVYKFVATLLVMVIAQAYVLANPGTMIFGRLATSANSIININGGEARTGTTIVSGSQIQTPENAAATVQLDSGQVEILPGTNLTLTFNKGNIDVNVTSGRASLTTNKGVTGALTFNGETSRTDSSMDTSTVSGGTADPQVTGNNWSNKKTGWLIFGGGIGALIIWWIIHHHNNNSPSRP